MSESNSIIGPFRELLNGEFKFNTEIILEFFANNFYNNRGEYVNNHNYKMAINMLKDYFNKYFAKSEICLNIKNLCNLSTIFCDESELQYEYYIICEKIKHLLRKTYN
jgi:hypothetical protein